MTIPDVKEFLRRERKRVKITKWTYLKIFLIILAGRLLYHLLHPHSTTIWKLVRGG